MTSSQHVPRTPDLQDLIRQGAFLVDVRTPEEFAEGSVPGAVNIPLDILPGKLAEFKGKEHTVLFCRSGARSGMAKTFLENNGLRGIVNGGSWQNVQQYAKS